MTSQPTITLNDIRAALALPDFDSHRAWEAMRLRPHLKRTGPLDGEKPRHAAVLVLIYPVDGVLTTLLMRRTPDPGVHSGQIGFPGGSWEPGDPDYTATALREACEEVGLCEPVTVLGHLTPVYIPPSRFLVMPTVATIPIHPVWKPNPDEVAELLELPLPHLLDANNKREKDWELGGMVFRVPYYDVDGQVVWGATALMLSELEGRLRAVLASRDSAVT